MLAMLPRRLRAGSGGERGASPGPVSGAQPEQNDASVTLPDARSRRRLRVAMALFGDLTHDSRVIREAEALATAGHSVMIACLEASPATIDRLAPEVRVLAHRPVGDALLPGDSSPFLVSSGSRVRRMAARVRWLWRYRASITRWGRSIVGAVGPVDVWHVHDLTGLEAVAPNVKQDARIIYDSHELFLERWSAARLPRFARAVLRFRESRLVSRCQAVITVNPGVAAELQRRYHPARIEVVRNCPPRWAPPIARPDRIRETLGLPVATPIVLFHGAIASGRGIGALVEALGAPGLEGVHLVLMGYGSLESSTGGVGIPPGARSRVHVLPAVSPDELLDWVASADVGAVLMEPVNQNLVLSTPNKLFEAIAVGTPVLASDFPEIRRVVIEDPDGPLGVLCDPTSHEDVVRALRRMFANPREELADMRERCLRAADARLNWEHEARHLISLYEA
jgi:glycosyltransferase involved in cell wall biosynthesis